MEVVFFFENPPSLGFRPLCISSSFLFYFRTQLLTGSKGHLRSCRQKRPSGCRVPKGHGLGWITRPGEAHFLGSPPGACSLRLFRVRVSCEWSGPPRVPNKGGCRPGIFHSSSVLQPDGGCLKELRRGAVSRFLLPDFCCPGFFPFLESLLLKSRPAGRNGI